MPSKFCRTHGIRLELATPWISARSEIFNIADAALAGARAPARQHFRL